MGSKGFFSEDFLFLLLRSTGGVFLFVMMSSSSEHANYVPKTQEKKLRQ